MIVAPSIGGAVTATIVTLGVFGYILNIIPLSWGIFLGIIIVGLIVVYATKDQNGIETDIKDLADHGVKSRILQRFPDPIQGYEVPEHWQVNKNLVTVVPKNPEQQETIIELRRKICDRLAKHAVIEGLRCAIIALKHYASLLDELTSETRINSFEEHQTIADGLYGLGEYQNAAIFYSKCLSSPSFDDKEKLNRVLSILRASIQQMEPQEFLEYALFAAKIARSHRDE